MMNNQFENQAKQFKLAIKSFDGALKLVSSEHIATVLGPYYGDGMEDTVLRSLFSDRYELLEYAVLYTHTPVRDVQLLLSEITSLYVSAQFSVNDRIDLITERLQSAFSQSELLTWGNHCYSGTPFIVHHLDYSIASFAAEADPVIRLTLLYYAGVLLLSIMDDSKCTDFLVSSLSDCFKEDYHDVARFHRIWTIEEV